MGGSNAGMQLSHFSGRQVCYSTNAPQRRPEPLLSDREREARGRLLASHWGSLLENERVNVLGSKAGSKERSRR